MSESVSPDPGQQAPAGWYADSERPGGHRYWDGTSWTEHRQPAPAAASGSVAQAGARHARLAATGYAAPSTFSSSLDAVTIIGYVCAFLIPFVGVAIGAVKMNQYSGSGANHGLRVLLISISAFVLYVIIIASNG